MTDEKEVVWTPSTMGKKGGPARAKKLSAARRKEIAKKATEARWGKKRKKPVVKKKDGT